MVQESVVIGHLLRADARFFTVGTRAQALEELQECSWAVFVWSTAKPIQKLMG